MRGRMDILQHEELRMGVVVCGGTRAKNWWSLDTAVTPTFSIARPCPIAILSYERKEPCTSSSSISSANCPVSSTLWLECILPELGAREDFGQRPPSDISLYICREDIAADLPSVDDEGPLWKQPEYYALLFYSSVVIRWARWRRAQPTETTAPPPRDEVVRKQRQIGALLRLMRLKKGLSGP